MDQQASTDGAAQPREGTAPKEPPKPEPHPHNGGSGEGAASALDRMRDVERAKADAGGLEHPQS